MRRLAAVAVVAVLATTLVACGDDEVCSRPDGAGCYPDPDPSGDDDRNEADEQYVQLSGASIGGLRQAADLALETSDSAEVLDLASDLVAELTDVADQLATFEEEWDLPQIVYDSAAILPHQDPNPSWQRLEDLEGAEFDALWAQLVAESLESVESSASTVVARGSNTELQELAEDLVDDCADWIDEVEALGV